jgi:hypothetical protein
MAAGIEEDRFVVGRFVLENAWARFGMKSNSRVLDPGSELE